jgi:ADP-ribose pyrophosphatase YjhB (NUDIX family)
MQVSCFVLRLTFLSVPLHSVHRRFVPVPASLRLERLDSGRLRSRRTRVCVLATTHSSRAPSRMDDSASAPARTDNARPQRFCTRCGAQLTIQTPIGDYRERAVCERCALVHYENPKVISACVATSRDRRKVLLCRRALRPASGRWTLPAGYLEIGETSRDAARREALEETNAAVLVGPLLAVYELLQAAQIQLVYRATLERDWTPADYRQNAETLEARLYGWDEIPWDMLAFPTVAWALRYARSTLHVPDSTLVPEIRVKSASGEQFIV